MNVYSSNELFDYLIVKKSTTKLEDPIPRQQKPINRPLGTVAGILSKIFNQKRRCLKREGTEKGILLRFNPNL